MDGFRFFDYSPTYREMMILKALSGGVSTHSEVAASAGIVPSLVNRYFKRLQDEGLVEKVDGRYQLTQKGQVRLNYLLLAYLSEIVDLYGGIEAKFQDIFLKLAGKRELCIFGAGVVGRMIEKLLTSRGGFIVAAFIDENPGKVGTRIDGVPVLSLSERCHADAYIVASFKNGEHMSKKLLELGYRSVYLVEFAGERLRLVWKG